MFGTLFLKECKQILKSMVYYIYVVVFVMFLTSQLSGEITQKLEKPQPGQESYGTINSQDESDVMEKELAELVLETYHNSYTTYPLGFYKGVVLNEEEIARVTSIIENCTGKSWDQLIKEMETHYSDYEQNSIQGAMQAQIAYSVAPAQNLSYDEFLRNMEEVCRVVGAGSSYQRESLQAGVSVPMTYEQAVEE